MDAFEGLAIAAGVVGVGTLVAAEQNINPFLPSWLGGGSAFGWATSELGPKFDIGGHNYWFTTWEAVCIVTGAILLALSKKLGVVAFLFGLALLGVGLTGFVFAWPFGS